MTLRPIDDSPTVPFWRVQSVFDTEGNGKDFAYTIGLFDEGFPELHLWGRPSLGEDPGEDWMLGIDDRGRVLNELVELLVSGRLHVGDEVRRGLPGASIGEMPELRGWATCMTTALSHRARLSADDVRTLALPFRADCPGFEELLNTPL